MPKGVYSIEGRRKVWTEDDRWAVEEMIAQGRSMAEIARRLGRSTVSVHVYCKRNLTIRRIRPLTARKAAELLGVGCSKSVTRWITAGWLKGRKSNVGAGRSRAWYVTDDALLEFLGNPAHWHRWEAARITEPALREWARETRTERYLTQAEVAQRFSVVRGTVAAWIDRGFLTAVDTGSHRMIAESALADWVMPSERSKRGKAARRFTAEEDARLIALRDGGASWSEIEYQLRRNLGSCAGRYARLQARRGEELAVAA